MNGAIPRSGLGETPGGAPTGSSLATTNLRFGPEIDAGHRLGTGIDDVQLAVVHEDCRPSNTVSTELPLSFTARPAACLETNTEPSER